MSGAINSNVLGPIQSSVSNNYLTLVTNHETGKIFYGAKGESASSLNRFFDDLGPDRAAKITAATMDMGPAFAKAFTDHCPDARICLDPYQDSQVRNEKPSKRLEKISGVR